MITKRLIEFWNRSKVGSEATMSGMWKSIVNNHQSDLIASLNSQNVEKVESLLNGGAASTHGIGDDGAIYWDKKLIPLLAECVGVVRVFNPESPKPSPCVDKSDIERKVGIRFDLPNCLHFNNSSGLPNRFFYAYSAAFTILLRLGYLPVNLLEIGAGVGLLGHICWQWKCPYTVIDLPSVAVLSAYYLSKLCGENEIWLYGEEENGKPFARFYPSTHYDQVKQNYDVIYNNDSLTEMDEQVMRDYLRFVNDRLFPDGFFLSINHESNSNTVLECSGGLKLRSRSSWMMRPGYMEEVYTKA